MKLRTRGNQNEGAQKIFYIKLRTNTEKINLDDPNFLRILQQQYATKYLESIGIEATTKNILNILKRYPLKDCELQQSRLNGGLHTDTITIIAKKKQVKQQKKAGNIQISNDMLKHVNLKKIRTDIFKEDTKQKKNNRNHESQSIINENDNSKKQNPKFAFDMALMKAKYIFPFNQNFIRKKNYALKESSSQFNLKNDSDKHLIFQSKIFSFPFTMVKVSINALKELQVPITVSLNEIVLLLDEFSSQFPKDMIPLKVKQKQGPKNVFPQIHIDKNQDKIQKQKFRNILPQMHQDKKQNDKTEKQKQKNTYTELHQDAKLSFTEQQKRNLFQFLKSEQMARFIGIFLHFSYWLIFGNVNPVQIQAKVRKQMYLILFQSFQYFNVKVKNKRLWITLYMPMIILTLKMTSQYLYKKMYPQFFQQNIFVKNSIGNIAYDKIIYLIDNLFDKSYLNGRFIFLESNFNDKQLNSSNDRKSIRKRIFGTSPMIDMILPDPKDGKARSILAKKHEIQYRQGIFQFTNNQKMRHQIKQELQKQIKKQEQQNLISQQQCRQKMLNVVLSKLQNKILSKLGHNDIIKLGGADQ